MKANSITPEILSAHKTPFLIIDLEKIRQNMRTLREHFSQMGIYYAIKAAPFDLLLQALAEQGASFDVASTYEVDQLLALGIPPEKMSYSNTIKKPEDIRYVFEKGIRIFASDAPSDLIKLAEHALGAKIFFRLNTEGVGADWPLSHKFGATPDEVGELMRQAKGLPLTPYGLSFHVGSQQRDIRQWDKSIFICHQLCKSAARNGTKLKALNLGGGLPTNYLFPTPPLAEYATAINRSLAFHFGHTGPKIFIEPGRYMAGDAGIIVSKVVMIAKRGDDTWVYLDIGKFGGLIETIDESIKYPITVIGKENSEKTMPVILAGPTCDSMDTLYEKFRYHLPENLAEGDTVLIHSTGAYTQSYCAVNFNGLPPLKTIFV